MNLHPSSGIDAGHGHPPPSQLRPQQQQQQQQQQRSIPQRSGPRANCDQVVFEAIAKAAEIVVASRCWIDSDPSAPPSGSGRFNLLVPEVKSVRNILQRWKRTMHVPLRLDVYYQHPPTPGNESGERELLERWCLEYAPTTASTNNNNGMYNQHHDNDFQSFHLDPIVQLRKVCKNIVVWLRTLYCHSRLLPAQALRKKQSNTDNTHNNNTHNNNHINQSIGFSIYVVGEGQDDVSGLLQQGFDSEPKPSAAVASSTLTNGVPTPYGVLGWKVYLAPKSLVRRLLALEQERARLLEAQRLQQQQRYSNTTSVPRSIPIQQQQQQQQQHPYGPSQQVARSAPTHNRGYRRANSEPVTTHANANAPRPPEHTRYHSSRSPGHGPNGNGVPTTLLAPRSYHQRKLSYDHNAHGNAAGIGRALYSHANAMPGSEQVTNEKKSPSPGETRTTTIHKNKNLSALSLALLSMKDERSPSSNGVAETNADANRQQLAPSKIRRAALHNAPPTAVAAGVGEYGYAYNNNHHQQQHNSQLRNLQQQQQQSPHALSSTPASGTYGTTPPIFRGPSTPASGTYGTTPPGYLLSATPSMGSHGTTPRGVLLPPTRKDAVAPPFVRPLGFAAQQPTLQAATTPQSQPREVATSHQLQNSPPIPQMGGAAVAVANPDQDDHKPSLDLLHSSPFHHGSVHHPNLSYQQQQQQQQQQPPFQSHQSPPKDGLSCFLQAEETASMEAATTFINDFYHHHYPMASLSAAAGGGDDHHYYHHHHHHTLSSEDYQHHYRSSLMVEASNSVAFLDHDSLMPAEDMPFAVDGLSPDKSGSNGHNPALLSGIGHEASLLSASMGMVPHKKLALFDHSQQHHEASTTNASADPSKSPVDVVDVDALTDQLADFRSFGVTLAAPSTTPLTTSVGSGG